MNRRQWKRALAGAGVAAGLALGALAAQDDGFDEVAVALAWHKVTGAALDVRALAERSEAVRRATAFDRPDALTAEVARLEGLLAAADPAREFTLRIGDNIGQYDHDRGEFSILLFSPGYYVPVEAFGRQYQLVFSNAAQARAIPMPKEEARGFDQRLQQAGRRVTNVLRFRVTGKGDPSGGVTGERVIRAELLASRLEDQAGTVLFTPTIGPAPAAVAEVPFDAAAVDVAGLRVGMRAGDLEATLKRLYGKAVRGGAGQSTIPALTGSLDMNSQGCWSFVGGREARPGTVCISAVFDDDDIVRMIRIERIFPFFDGELFRRALVGKYGPVADARGGGGYLLSWGPEVAPGSFFKGGAAVRALTATWSENDSYLARSGNAIPKIGVVLQLIDAAWAARQGK